jgi:hypothetical protein
LLIGLIELGGQTAGLFIFFLDQAVGFLKLFDRFLIILTTLESTLPEGGFETTAP